MLTSGLTQRPALLAYQWFWNAVDWVFPPNCGGCDQLGERWCDNCQQKIVRLEGPLCEVCGNPLPQGGICSECRSQPPLFKALRSYCAYQSPVRDAIHRLKYQRDIGLGEALSHSLRQLAATLTWQPDVVVSVPLSSARLRQRGYNQASLLALPLAIGLGRPFDAHTLARTRETNTQVGLSAADRKCNVTGAFTASQRAAGKTILVVDDVITTGSTMNACAQALLTAGAIAVYGLSFARALLPDHQVQINPLL